MKLILYIYLAVKKDQDRVRTGLDMERSRIDYFSRESEEGPFKTPIKKEDDILREEVTGSGLCH